MIRGATATSAGLAMLVAAALAAGSARAAGTQFSCSGVKIEPAGRAQAPITAKLSLLSPEKIALTVGDSDIRNTVTGDNQITLNFRTRDFTGEFFHYTNDLFLIYHSGHLAKLSCTPAQ